MSHNSRRGPKDWTPSSSLEKKLKTKARDNHGYSYDVWLRFENRYASMGYKWTLHIDGTPGHWFMSTLLLHGPSDQISIDHGQRWDVINFREIMDEAVTLI